MIGLPHDKPLMIAIGGMSGTGKSTLADSLQKKIPGAVVLDPDALRKRMFGVSPQTPLPDTAYSPENIKNFIAYAHAEAARHLKDGRTVIVSGLFLDHNSRAEQEELAARNGARFVGLYLHASLSTIYGRVVRRIGTGSASDADLKIARRQARAAYLNPARDKNWQMISARQGPADVLTRAMRCIGTALKTRPAVRRPRRPPRQKPGSF
jgi:predicted kinase